ncbi:glycerophosphodiester phosphodiesterase, putative (GDPD) [Plasmodium ovale wallikeri]|nr:glycerophosphodiester phosphodiesterase, putative (GDPD) [Plasmodium ovale wallikeri]SBT47033.1 glycerophosphodiester phosphodiesterase, putative (GDPD) [Plasmodium ovale wallikeri]
MVLLRDSLPIFFFLFLVLFQLQCCLSSMTTTIVGHRGCGSSDPGGSSLYPENSLYSIKQAIDHKIDGIELDVWLTKDNKVVVIHGTEDGLLGHTLLTGKDCANKFIEELTAKEIQSYHYREPWVLTKGKAFYSGGEVKGHNECPNDISKGNTERMMYASLSETEKLQKVKEYDEYNCAYINMEENDELEKMFNENFLDSNNFYASMQEEEKQTEIISDQQDNMLRPNKEEGQQRDHLHDQESEDEFVNSIECEHCRSLYTMYISKKENYDLKKKKMLFHFISKFYHVPLLEDLLNIYKNKLTYDIELKGTKEDLGIYLLHILEKYKDYTFKFSSFNWVLQDDNIKKKMLKNKNMQEFDYFSYPFYNHNKIDLLKVLRNNKLNIPVALLFSDDDDIMPNFNSILCTMKYYNADWAHFSYRMNKKPIIINCNKKNKTILVNDLIDLLHKNNKKVMIYWGTEDKDNYDDIMFYLKLNVDSICPNNIDVAKMALQNA